MATTLTFVQAQGQAIKFWGRTPADSLAERIAFQVTDGRGTRTVEFARDVDDYIVS